MSRQKKVIQNNISGEAYEGALSGYSYSEAKLRKIQAEIDLQTLKIKHRYAGDLAEHTANREECFGIVQQYCTENQDELFANKKSMETAYGVLGFRTGTPKLKTAKGFTWASCLSLLKKLKPEYVRIKEEPNKENLLADREKIDLKELGLEVDRDEVFYIEIQTEEDK